MQHLSKSTKKSFQNIDFLIIGSGIAGLSFALKAAKYGRVLIITKNKATDSNTSFAQGGIACVTALDDDAELHVKDTLVAGAGLCNEEAVRTMVAEAPACIKDLLEWGVSFSYNDSDREAGFELGLEGGHSRNRIVHMKDFTGREIETALLKAVKNNTSITLLENHIALDLVTDDTNQKTCYGAYVLDIIANEIKTYYAHDTIICTGGAGQVYKNTTNPAIATGDGIAMASRAGARISNMEFIQFHPTALYNPGGKVFLISEALRGAGAVLCNAYGEEFMHIYHPLGSLAPRDIVSRGVVKELEKSASSHVFLDATKIPSDQVIGDFPQIYETCLSEGIDITKELIPVVPSAHFFCGGIETDINGKTSITSLYAFGEAACTGVHGANRLASNSLLEAMVFSNRALMHIISGFNQAEKEVVTNAINTDYHTITARAEPLLIKALKQQVQEITEKYCGISRTIKDLEMAMEQIPILKSKVKYIFNNFVKTQETIELYNLTLISELIIESALSRKESKGAHFILSAEPVQIY